MSETIIGADAQRYAVVNTNDQIVMRIMWDGVSLWEPPEGCRVMLESEAIAAGYPDAPPEDPIQE